MQKLTDLPFDNTYARLPATFHDRVAPTPVPDLVSFNPAAAELIDLDPAEARKAERYRARSEVEPASAAEREAKMDRANPQYVLRNYLAQQAITRAEDQRDYGEVGRLLDLVRDPFTERPGMEEFAKPAPQWGKHLVVSCSS